MEINKALEIITDSDDLYDGYGYLTKLGYEALATIEGVDVVEVVRCKDCKYRAKGLPYCAYFGETDFCSYGERKETK